MNQILFVNSSSFVDVSITSSLISALNSNIDFSLSSQVSGSFVGSLQGTASKAINADTANTSTTASYAIKSNLADSASQVVSSSYALTAGSTISSSYSTHASTSDSSTTSETASYVSGILVKSGIISGSSFSGNPKTYVVVFNTDFLNTDYSITVAGQSARTWVIQNVTPSGFTINSNANQTLTGLVFWQAISVGEYSC